MKLTGGLMTMSLLRHRIFARDISSFLRFICYIPSSDIESSVSVTPSLYYSVFGSGARVKDIAGYLC